MSSLAPTLEAFFVDRLLNQHNASPQTVSSYRDSLRLLLVFANTQLDKPPYKLDFTDIDAQLVRDYLNDLENQRQNSVRTRNARLAAIRSFFRYAALYHPEHAAQIQQILAIPSKRYTRKQVCYLSREETSSLLEAPERSTWIGRRDHMLLLMAIHTGLRVSEIVNVKCGDVVFGTSAYIRCTGKGRKERTTPLARDTVSVLKKWMTEREGGPHDPLFTSVRGSALSVDSVQRLVAKHSTVAVSKCSSMSKKTVTPHTLRHTCAMNLLHSGVDTSVIALWLGHEHIQTTQIYLHNDIELKEKALEKTMPHSTKPGRYKPPDSLLAFLERL